MEYQEKMRAHIHQAFQKLPATEEIHNTEDELYADLLDRYEQALAEGAEPEQAYHTALNSLGDIGELVNSLVERPRTVLLPNNPPVPPHHGPEHPHPPVPPHHGPEQPHPPVPPHHGPEHPHPPVPPHHGPEHPHPPVPPHHGPEHPHPPVPPQDE